VAAVEDWRSGRRSTVSNTVRMGGAEPSEETQDDPRVTRPVLSDTATHSQHGPTNPSQTPPNPS
jgi:hypothetical protein